MRGKEGKGVEREKGTEREGGNDGTTEERRGGGN